MGGFNLLELMITLVIVGILSAISVPIYSHHLARENRLEAEISLVKLAAALEQYHMVNNTYAGATLSELAFAEKIAQGHYQLAIASANDNEFVLSAEPVHADTLCGNLFLDSSGKKSAGNTTALKECWY